MIEIYSKNITVGENELIPFNIVSLKKGATVTNSGSYELVFNQCGVYQLTVSAVAKPATATTTEDANEAAAAAEADATTAVSINLIKDGVVIPQAQSEETSTDAAALSFSTLVQVNRNNNPCVCSTPVVCSIRNTGVAATFSSIDVVVTKIV